VVAIGSPQSISNLINLHMYPSTRRHTTVQRLSSWWYFRL